MIQGLFNKAKGLYAAFQDLHPLICMAGHKYDLSLGIGLVDLPDQIDPVQLLPAQIKIQEIEIGPRIFLYKAQQFPARSGKAGDPGILSTAFYGSL